MKQSPETRVGAELPPILVSQVDFYQLLSAPSQCCSKSLVNACIPNLMWGTRWINSTLCSGMCVVIKVFLNADVQSRLVCSSAFLSVRCGNGWSSVSPPYPLGHSGTNICFASVLEDKYSMGHRITICTSWTVPHPVLLTIAVCLLLDITWVGLVLLLFCFSLCRRAKV